MADNTVYGWLSDSMNLNGFSESRRKVIIKKVFTTETGLIRLYITSYGPKYGSEIIIPEYNKPLLAKMIKDDK